MGLARPVGVERRLVGSVVTGQGLRRSPVVGRLAKVSAVETLGAEWDQSTDVAVNRRAERIFKSMDWDLQARFEHLSDEILTGDGYLLADLNILDVLAGEKQASEMRRVVRRALSRAAARRRSPSLSSL